MKYGVRPPGASKTVSVLVAKSVKLYLSSSTRYFLIYVPLFSPIILLKWRFPLQKRERNTNYLKINASDRFSHMEMVAERIVLFVGPKSADLKSILFSSCSKLTIQ